MSDAVIDNNKVGYRRPPKASQFQKGKSGNPNGRPKGVRNFVSVLEGELSKPVTITENGKKTRITRLEAMVKRMVAGALQGDQKATLTLFEILRRNGKLERGEPDSLLPTNYEEILAEYLGRQQGGNTPPAKSNRSSNSER